MSERVPCCSCDKMALINILALAVLDEEDRRIKKRIIRPQRHNAFDFSEADFVSLFRVNKPICIELIEKLRPALEARSARRNVFSVETKVLCALQFFGTGCHQKNVANDICNSMSQQSVSNIIRDVTSAINLTMMEDYIKFPVLKRERELTKKEFMEYSGFPGVIGAIDCTHVALKTPSDHENYNENNYINLKGFHSLNVQLVCDVHLKVLSINARFPGCTEDCYIWTMSQLRDWFVVNAAHLESTWLLGDSGYPSEPWLMTPVEGTSTEASNFNSAHELGRSVIEKCNRVLKSRFKCLTKSRALNYAPTFVGKIVNAVVVIHNMCIQQNLTIETDIGEDDEPFNTGFSDVGSEIFEFDDDEPVDSDVSDKLSVNAESIQQRLVAFFK